jgi:hypothetical protein
VNILYTQDWSAVFFYIRKDENNNNKIIFIYFESLGDGGCQCLWFLSQASVNLFLQREVLLDSKWSLDCVVILFTNITCEMKLIMMHIKSAFDARTILKDINNCPGESRQQRDIPRTIGSDQVEKNGF